MNYITEQNRIFAQNESGKVLAEITFPVSDNTATINHTFVDESLRGQGIASELVEMAYLQILKQGYDIQCTCSYAKKWMETHIIKVGHEQTYTFMDKDNVPSATVHSGDYVEISTELNGGDWLQTTEDRWAPGKSKGPNRPVVIGVENAQPGDTLQIDILNIVPGPVGYTGFAGWRTKLPGIIWPDAKDWDVVTKTVSISQDGVRWSDSLKLPLEPMIGTIGTAPQGEKETNYYAWHNGGNMDVQEIRKGTTLYLPVSVDNALLHVGDCHAIMGDGEIPFGGAIECRATVTLKVSVLKGYKAKEWLRAEDEEYLMTIANEDKMKDSFCGAVRELMHWMSEDYGFTPQEAYLLLGSVLEARCTMLHGDDGRFSPYIAKIKKKYLHADKHTEWRKP